MDFDLFCQDYGVQTAPARHRHARPGWLSVACPFCDGRDGFHLGWSIDGKFFSCWRCRGGKSDLKVVQALLDIGYPQASEIVKNYSGRPDAARKWKASETVTEIKLPEHTYELDAIRQVKAYLEGRDYDCDELQRTWKIRASTRFAPVPLAVVIPVYHAGKLVSYRCRDTTGHLACRYMACKADAEGYPHKETLYGAWNVRGDSVVVVEGEADAWRLGPCAVATYGIAYTNRQLLRLADYKRRFLMYDTDIEGRTAARKLADELAQFGGVTEIIAYGTAVKDPGALAQADADAIMRELLYS